MIDVQQISDIERAMREEHEKDLEALRRLRKYLPNQQEITRTIAVPPRNGARPSLKTKVLELVNAEPTLEWKRSELEHVLDQEGFTIAAQNRAAAINQVLRALVRNEEVTLVVQGVGKAPSVYRSIQQPET